MANKAKQNVKRFVQNISNNVAIDAYEEAIAYVYNKAEKQWKRI